MQRGTPSPSVGCSRSREKKRQLCKQGDMGAESRQKARVAPGSAGLAEKPWRGGLSTWVSLQRWTELARQNQAKSVPRAECQALTKAWACEMHWGSGNDENVNLSKAAAMLITPFLVSSIFIAKTLSFFYSQYLVLDVKNTEHCFALSLHYCFNVPLRWAPSMPLTGQRPRIGECLPEKQR